MIKLRDYQKPIVDEGFDKLVNNGILLIFAEMRTGKTIISLSIAHRYLDTVGSKNPLSSILFVTKKNVISTIKKDADLFNDAGIHITNYEQCHKLKEQDYDIVIVDESHNIGKFPIRSKRAKDLKKVIGKNPVIYMTGTPTPESYSQIFHQLWTSNYSPFEEKNFYKWAKNYVEVHKIHTSSHIINDYSHANIDLIYEKIDPIVITLTQTEADIETNMHEQFIYTNLNDHVHEIMRDLIKDRIYMGPDFTLIADTAIRLQGFMHQLSGGTVIDNDGNRCILDRSKADFIKTHLLKGKKVGIFYCYVAEREVLEEILPNVIDDPEDFNNYDGECQFLAQIRSGSEGISLRGADYLVYYNIGYSATQYIQSRARIQDTRRDKENKIIWLFSQGGMEQKIHNAVSNKMRYTNRHFRREYGIR